MGRDEQWATWTCKIGWPVIGIFPPGTDGSHVNGVDRSKNRKLIITADDFGLLNLYRNPVAEGNKALSYRAHSEHVVRAIFDQKDTHVFSVGGFDKAVMQWKVAK
eukprot:TRINITY_DN1410_c0_g2_i4.p1 TRINITY_DN1410_c0_g2~~TRINITY_DN1410_c0_g2_i4.p1  ORF type:complete len:105 (-),score=10.02 TRINITY_DN1410_c0_g2_i4:56-370(-)